jgi:pilus assembly protein FimV
MTHPITKLIALAILVFTTNTAFAVALGDMQTHTRLGDRLKADIPISLGQASYSADEVRATLMSTKQAAKHGVQLLSERYQFKLSIREQDGQLVVSLASQKPITEPFINLMLQLDWPGGSLAREYTVMLDY